MIPFPMPLHSTDPSCWAVYADWLEAEAGEPDRAAWARRVSAGLRKRTRLVFVLVGWGAVWSPFNVDWKDSSTLGSKWGTADEFGSYYSYGPPYEHCPADFPGLIEERPQLAEEFFTRIAELAQPDTETLPCGCEVMRGWRCPMHGAP